MKIKLNNKGITLIALVVTIIVLLILAGISIGAISGDNGIIQQAKGAKEDTQRKGIEEQIEIAIIKVEQEKNNPNMDDIINELIKQDIISDESKVDKETGAITTKNPEYIIEGKLDDYIIPVIDTIEEAKKYNTIFEQNTPIKDSYGNIVKVPEGFKIAIDSADDVTGGVVIEDATEGETFGSQFVWIPVGTVYTNKEKTESKEIPLNRYTYTSDGVSTPQNDNSIDGILEGSENIENFKTKAQNSKGYYIGRFEARDAKVIEPRKSTTGADNKVVCTKSNYIYNYVTKTQALTLSQSMYVGKNFSTDLMNGYSWDTAIYFIQEFSKKTKYSHEQSLNKGSGLSNIAQKGTIDLSSDMQDKVCNIWDIASNLGEWSTEYSEGDHPEIYRGGTAASSNYASGRYKTTQDYKPFSISFRPILYL